MFKLQLMLNAHVLRRRVHRSAGVAIAASHAAPALTYTDHKAGDHSVNLCIREGWPLSEYEWFAQMIAGGSHDEGA